MAAGAELRKERRNEKGRALGQSKRAWGRRVQPARKEGEKEQAYLGLDHEY